MFFPVIFLWEEFLRRFTSFSILQNFIAFLLVLLQGNTSHSCKALYKNSWRLFAVIFLLNVLSCMFDRVLNMCLESLPESDMLPFRPGHRSGSTCYTSGYSHEDNFCVNARFHKKRKFLSFLVLVLYGFVVVHFVFHEDDHVMNVLKTINILHELLLLRQR